MQWLNEAVDKLLALDIEGDIIVSSGVSPSGTYHLGTLREVLTAEAIAWELKRRGRSARHLHIVDDMDIFRKVPINVPDDFKKYLGLPLYKVPSPDGSAESYADYYLNDLKVAGDKLNLEFEIVRSNVKYREGFFVEAIEKALDKKDAIKDILEKISGHKVDENWSPIQVIEDGYLKNRQLVSFNKDQKVLIFKDGSNQDRQISYDEGDVKLNWRIDWPARWWLLRVAAEPFGRDHATKGGSYDTGAAIVKEVYDFQPPLPMPYDFINRTGETKKMSKSAGDVITAAELLEILPSEVVWFFVLRYPPSKQLFFDSGATLIRLVDEFSELLSKPEKSDSDKQLLELCLHGLQRPTISSVPFSLLVASYQASLRDPNKTIEVIGRTEYAKQAQEEADIIKAELNFIDAWLDKSAPEDIKFSLSDDVDRTKFSDVQINFLEQLAGKIETAPPEADGTWFHSAIYDLKDECDLSPKQMFETIYTAVINKQSGPRAGWFLSILPREWLIKRLRFAH